MPASLEPVTDVPGAAGGVPVSAPGAAPAWAGECWAIEAELTRKTVRRTTAIMAEILTRTGDYGCPAGEVRIPGVPAAARARAVPVLGRGPADRPARP